MNLDGAMSAVRMTHPYELRPNGIWKYINITRRRGTDPTEAVRMMTFSARIVDEEIRTHLINASLG